MAARYKALMVAGGIARECAGRAEPAGIMDLCQAYGVARLDVFGSVMTDAFDPDRSDVDFLVDYPSDYDFGPWLSRFQDLEAALASVIGRDVDLVMESALKNPWFAREAAKT